MKLVVGLGNPGTEYEQTRHNIGFLVIERLASRHSIHVARTVCGAAVGEGMLEACDVMLAKPQTFMNRSGQAVDCLLRDRSIGFGDLVVVSDDLDLPFGRIRIRPGGGSGGHRGLVSIAEALGTQEFPRVRVGIGRPLDGSAVDYVLDRFSTTEVEQLSAVLERAADATQCLLQNGVERAMGIYNRAICKA